MLYNKTLLKFVLFVMLGGLVSCAKPPLSDFKVAKPYKEI